MSGRSFFLDDAGVNAVVEYLITFMMAFVMFTLVLTMFNGLFIDGPKDSVTKCQYADIGNDVTAKIVDTYLIAPASGNISTSFETPMTVAGKGYRISVEPGKNSRDKEVLVFSSYSGVKMLITLNGVNSTIPIRGSAFSENITHQIRYDS